MGGRGVKLKYLHAFRDHTGTLRYYFRRNGIRTKLPGLFGSREFLDAYAAALGEQSGEPAERTTTLPGSFLALARRYFASPQFLSLLATSQTNYRRAIDRFLIEHGHRRVDQMKREHVDAVLGKFADKPGAGIILLKRMRTLLRYAVEIGWRESDPTSGDAHRRRQDFGAARARGVIRLEPITWAAGGRGGTESGFFTRVPDCVPAWLAQSSDSMRSKA